MKPKPRRNSRVTVFLPEQTLDKLGKIAEKITPQGAKPTASVAIRHLIDKEPL